MTFSYVQLHPTRRLWLVAFAAGRTIEQCCEIVPGSVEGEGVSKRTYEWWRETDPLFVECLEHIKADPDWCHEHIVAPWALAEDDLMQMQKMLGIKKDPDRPWWGLSAKQRELLLNERGKLNREESQNDRFLVFLERIEREREKRMLAGEKRQALPLPPPIDQE